MLKYQPRFWFSRNKDCDFGGGDDHCYMDLPGELVGRGRDVFLDHVGNAVKLAEFGDGGQVMEGFPCVDPLLSVYAYRSRVRSDSMLFERDTHCSCFAY